MDAKQFLAEFGHIVNAPGGVQRLRDIVLFLAVSGNLVKIDEVGSAIELIESIREKKRTHKEQRKVVPAQAPLSSIEISAPEHWVICRLGDLVLTITGGGTPSKSNPKYWNGDIHWASVKDLGDKKYLRSTQDRISREGLQNSSSNLIPARRVIVCTRMGLGKIVINTIPVAINQDLKALELPSEVDPDFFFILYKTRDIHGKGTTVSGINQNQLMALPAVLPPLDEQRRIVAKVHELMALCGRLETQQQRRRELQTRARTAVLDIFGKATNSYELKDAWLRVQDNMSLLMDVPEDISGFRKSLVQTAISGNYTNIQTHDESAEDLLQKTIAEKACLMKSKGISRPRPLPEIGKIPFTLPKDWKWIRLGEIAKVITSGSRGWAKYYSGEGAIFIGMGNLSKDDYKLRLHHIQHVTPPKGAEGDRTQLESGDILISITGDVGMLGLIPEGFGEAYINQHTCLVRLMNGLENRYFAELLRSPLCRKQFNEPQRGIKNSFRLSDVAELLVPLPPIDEQRYLLAIIDKQMQLCDQLENSLAKAQRIAERLSQAAVASITGTQTKGKEIMKAPRTELMTKLKLAASPEKNDQAPLAAILARHDGELSAKGLWNYSGLEIDGFYQQLKIEMARGWIVEPEKARVMEKAAEPNRAETL